MNHVSQGRPESSSCTCKWCCSTSIQKSEVLCLTAHHLLPCHLCPSPWSVPPVHLQLCWEVFLSLQLLLSLTPLLEEKLEINFRCSSSFMWCGCCFNPQMQLLGTEQTVQNNGFQSTLTWTGGEPTLERQQALQSSHSRFPLACRVATTTFSSQDRYKANSISLRSWLFIWFFRELWPTLWQSFVPTLSYSDGETGK